MAAALLCLFITAQGQEFWSNGIHYNLTEDGNAEVTYMDCYYGWYETYYNYFDQYSGDIVIPSEVTAWVTPMYSEPFEVTAEVVGIGENAFISCYDLTSVTLPNSIKYIAENAFYECTALTSINLPDGLEIIQDNAFSYCGLQSIVIPSSVTEIGWGVFFSCENLTSANIPEGITELGGTFMFCTSLKTINLPNSLQMLDMTFKGCNQLEAIDLPSTVTEVGIESFYNCTQLQTVICRAITPPSAWNSSFYSSDNYIYNNTVLCVPGESLESYREADGWCNFVNIAAIGDEVKPGDLDGDGEITIGDVTDLIDLILSHASVADHPSADVNGDGNIAIDDLVDLIDIMLGL